MSTPAEILADAIAIADQAIATTRTGADALTKIGSRSAPTLTKMTEQLATIREGLAVLEAYERSQPQHRSVQ